MKECVGTKVGGDKRQHRSEIEKRIRGTVKGIKVKRGMAGINLGGIKAYGPGMSFELREAGLGSL